MNVAFHTSEEEVKIYQIQVLTGYAATQIKSTPHKLQSPFTAKKCQHVISQRNVNIPLAEGDIMTLWIIFVNNQINKVIIFI